MSKSVIGPDVIKDEVGDKSNGKEPDEVGVDSFARRGHFYSHVYQDFWGTCCMRRCKKCLKLHINYNSSR